jgi:IS4 transposase
LRRVTHVDLESGQRYEFLTNNFALAASTIAAIYKQRWQIELFFKWIKQNLKIKTFLGTSSNAVMTQVWVAVCIFLMLAYLKYLSKTPASMQQILRLLQLNLFMRRGLVALLHGDPPRPQPPSPQAQLAFA